MLAALTLPWTSMRSRGPSRDTGLRTLALAIIGALSASLAAQEASLVARWDFGSEGGAALRSHGGVHRDQAGPRPPEFPDFDASNLAVRLDGRGAYLSIEDPGLRSPYDFTNGDALTLEAWIRPDGDVGGSPMYIIGKGRTGAPSFARDNQNWALRIVAAGDKVKLSFLFATPLRQGSARDAHWHRWTSDAGFDAATGWHHVAVTYRFGDADSMRGWIDGQPTLGVWDMGGATKESPVVDDDAVWIGSSRSGSNANSFRGWLDAVAVHRELLPDEVIAARFRRVGGPRALRPLPEVMPHLDVPDGRVLVTLAEGLPTHERWLREGESWPAETLRWLGDELLLPRIPLRYDDWGIRAAWKPPVLLRLAADVELSPGEHRFLLRARGLSRLWVDGEIVARTEPASSSAPSGEEPITPLAKPPAPGLRAHGYRQQEVFGDAVIGATGERSRRTSRVVLELIIGGKNQRTETGELCVAVESENGKSYEVLRSSPAPQALPLTDVAVGAALERIETALSRHDDATRRRAAASQDAFWRGRHARARRWAAQHSKSVGSSERSVSRANGTSSTVSHPIDEFITDKIERARGESSKFDAATTQQFHSEVLPLLREKCFRCHGEKGKGGLRLDSRELALRSGDSEVPAVVPGDVDSSELIVRVREGDMPPKGEGLTAQEIDALETWIRGGALWPAPPISEADAELAPLIDDEAFLRRVHLDTIGLPPSLDRAKAFLADASPDKRQRLIDTLLDDERCADHWMSCWQDVLAENPTLLNASLNSTGPFRWYLYEAFRDGRALDRVVSELIQMRGGRHEGGSAGFAMAGENDSPFAAKGHILAAAFLGVELQCARCHDSPYHSTTQRDLYSLAAMLQRKPLTVPSTSRVPDAFFEKKGRESLIRVTLKPDEPVAPAWPFAAITGVVDDAEIDPLMRNPADSRERLATLITAPKNARFAKVIVNRLWKRLMGAGIVEPANDWEGREASHPRLLEWLALELIAHDYDLRHVTRTILSSRAYQRVARGCNAKAPPEHRFFSAPDRRRLTAEQVVDSLHAATGSAMDVEELTFVHDGRRPLSNRLTLGRPTRAWMFASLNNERDRPSLSLPRARAVTDVLEAFGWTGSRQRPIEEREVDPDVLQPGILANGTLTMTLTRAAEGSELAQWAVDAESPGGLVEDLFLRVLGRPPRSGEEAALTSALARGFETRRLPDDEVVAVPALPRLPLVTWFNHLRPKANTIQQEVERRVREGPPPNPRLRAEWREVYEDFVWSLINHREFVWIP